jgi:hypothetical protein
MTEFIERDNISPNFLKFNENFDELVLFSKLIHAHQTVFNEFISENNLENLDKFKGLMPSIYYSILSRFTNLDMKIHVFKLFKKLVNIKFSEDFKTLMENQSFNSLFAILSNKFGILLSDMNHSQKNVCDIVVDDLTPIINITYKHINIKDLNFLIDYFESNENQDGIELLIKIINIIIIIKFYVNLQMFVLNKKIILY